MGKPSAAIPSKKTKDKGKGKRKGPEAPKVLKKHLEETSTTESASQPTLEQEPVSEPSKAHAIEELEQEEELQPRRKRGRAEPPTIPVEGPSSHALAWDPALLFGQLLWLLLILVLLSTDNWRFNFMTKFPFLNSSSNIN